MTQQCKWIRVAEAISTPKGQDPEGITVKINRARLGISNQLFLFPLEKRPAASYKKGGKGAGGKWLELTEQKLGNWLDDMPDATLWLLQEHRYMQ